MTGGTGFNPEAALAQDLAVIGKLGAKAPRVGVVLGSGLGAFVNTLEDSAAVGYAALPGFPESTVAGHRGRLALGTVRGVPVVVQQGRFHLYEGYEPGEVAYPVRVMRALGAETLIITNAAGSLRPEWKPGTLMLLRDHINFQFRGALRGRGSWVDSDRFVDLAEPYDTGAAHMAREAAIRLGLPLKEGTYFGVLGPSYETPAEVRMIGKLGGDAVGMSTIAEVITAKHCGMRVLGISCLANAATGLCPDPLTHDEVLQAVAAAQEPFAGLLSEVIAGLS